MHSLVLLYQSIPTSAWQLIGAALGLSGLLQAAKHFFFGKLSAHVLMTITVLVSAAGSALQYGLSTAKDNPTFFGGHTVALVGAMTMAYRYVVAPLSGLLVDAKTYRAQTKATPVTTETITPTEASF